MNPFPPLRCFLSSNTLVNYFKSNLFFFQPFWLKYLLKNSRRLSSQCYFWGILSSFLSPFSSHSSWTPDFSLHPRFSFLRGLGCLHQTWSGYLLSGGICHCHDPLPGLTSNLLDSCPLNLHFTFWFFLLALCWVGSSLSHLLSWHSELAQRVRKYESHLLLLKLSFQSALGLPLPDWMDLQWSPLVCLPRSSAEMPSSD